MTVRGVHRFSSRPLCVFNTMTSWSKYDLLAASDLVNIDQWQNVGRADEKVQRQIARDWK